jgi:hypothetical protein
MNYFERFCIGRGDLKYGGVEKRMQRREYREEKGIIQKI